MNDTEKTQALEDVNTNNLAVFIRDAMSSFIKHRTPTDYCKEEGVKKYVDDNYAWMNDNQKQSKIEEVMSRVRLAKMTNSISNELAITLNRLLKEHIEKETTT